MQRINYVKKAEKDKSQTSLEHKNLGVEQYLSFWKIQTNTERPSLTTCISYSCLNIFKNTGSKKEKENWQVDVQLVTKYLLKYRPTQINQQQKRLCLHLVHIQLRLSIPEKK